MDHMPEKGPLSDGQLEVIDQAGILVNGKIIEAVGTFRELSTLAPVTEKIEGSLTVIPGFIDVHTHICWAGSRAQDYAMRLEGKSYIEIAQKGGGIWSTVSKTREASQQALTTLTAERAEKLLKQGITTMEAKSGYGLNVETELKMLHAIHEANTISSADLISTCLAAHIKPKDFSGSAKEYLEYIVRNLLPVIISKKLASRTDIYIDDGAFTPDEARYYLDQAKKMGFDFSVHAGQFSSGGLQVAVELGAISADHLETTTPVDISLLASSETIPVVLPGASMGLGMRFAPARRFLDNGTSLVIASDWNPGSAPMGRLLMQASVLGVFEKLSIAETLAALTFRAARVLKLNDRGILRPGMAADFIGFPCSDYREIIYNQGNMMPEMIWKMGKRQ
jgi:imidazolonepropionase